MARTDRLDTLALDYVDRIESVDDQSDLMAMFFAALSEFGFTSFLITGLPHKTTAFSDHTILNGWPNAWYARYAERQYYNVEAGECGLKDGLLVPIYGANGDQSCITMAGKDIDRRHRAKQSLHLMSMFTHHQAIRLHELGKRKTTSTANRLTLRERECLQWAARGKTDWETSRILQISNNTVSVHIAKATKKMTATNRTEAVAKAIVNRHITL